MDFYKKNLEEVFKELKTSEDGLTTKEASIRQEKYGKNIIEIDKKPSKWLMFLNEFKNLMIIILLLSAIASFILSLKNNESFFDSIIIISIVIVNAFLGFIQELKADNAINELKKMQKVKVKVKRNGEYELIDSDDIVVGDILVLESGDNVCADARIIWSTSLKVDESSLTGESIPVFKEESVITENKSLVERTNMLYNGSSISYGKALAVVSSIGENTELGLIAKSLKEVEKELTPLEIKINEISKILTLIITIIIIIMFSIGLIQGLSLKEVVMLSISLAVAAIPEGLPAVITIVLSLGMKSLASKKAIIRKMSSVETLGCTEVICTDKTGTITQNKMSVCRLYVDGLFYLKEDKIKENILIQSMILNNDVYRKDDEYLGDPSEIALLTYCSEHVSILKIKNKYKRISEIPFDSERKMMSTINDFNGKKKILTKGSFDSIIKICDRYLENGEVRKLNKGKINELTRLVNDEAKKSYRILAFAYNDLKDKYKNENIENDLIFIGFVCMIDPPREDVLDAIALCKSAHIRPVMITGDSLLTATSIAKEVGILNRDDEAISGFEVDKMSKEELKEAVNRYSVYARVSPINKLAIVEAWKSNNKVVAMAGDGVNDAPAIKSANIGIGMGITGTEVSKNVSDVILADDSFSTIVSAVREGRRIYDNIRNVLFYLLTSNIAEVLIVFLCMIFGIEIFLPIQLLYINLITDSIPAIALAFEKEESDIMKRNVRKKDTSFFTSFLIMKMIISSIFKTAAVLLVYFVYKTFISIEVAQSLSFLTLIIIELIFAYSCRNLKKSLIETGIFGNKYLNKCMIALIIIQVLVFFSPLKTLFRITSISLLQFVNVLSICVVVFILDEILKSALAKIFKD